MGGEKKNQCFKINNSSSVGGGGNQGEVESEKM